jgi:hypothetical protein
LYLSVLGTILGCVSLALQGEYPTFFITLASIISLIGIANIIHDRLQRHRKTSNTNNVSVVFGNITENKQNTNEKIGETAINERSN